MKNFAFIDAQNVYIAIQQKGWKLDYKKTPHADGTA